MKNNLFMRCLSGVVGMVCAALCQAAESDAPPWSIAFYYGKAPQTALLSRFDMAVIEPDNGFDPRSHAGKTRWLAYVSVGEVMHSRPYFRDIPKSWIVGRNREWQSEVIDSSAAGWSEFIVSRIIAPLWRAGYQGFFLDTLDSYQLVSRNDEDRQRYQQGLVAIIQSIHRNYPQARLILNRGFELLPTVHEQVYAVAFESLFKGWSEAKQSYVDVPTEGREWLLAQVKMVKSYGVPVIAIDYCPPEDASCAKALMRQIREQGLVPYVTDGGLGAINPASLP